MALLASRASSPLSSLSSSPSEDGTVPLSASPSPSPRSVAIRATDGHDDERVTKRPRLFSIDPNDSIMATVKPAGPSSPAQTRDATDDLALRRDEVERTPTTTPMGANMRDVSPSHSFSAVATETMQRDQKRGVYAITSSQNGGARPLATTTVAVSSNSRSQHSSSHGHFASQELRLLQQDLNSQDLDEWLPSSQLQPSSSAALPFAGASTFKRPAHLRRDGDAVDDSGVFFMDGDLLEKDDSDLAVGGEEEVVGGELEAKSAVVVDADGFDEYEGDDMWDSARLEELDGELNLVSQPNKGRGRAVDSEQEEDAEADEGPVYDDGDPTEQLLGFGFGDGFQAPGAFGFRNKATVLPISEEELRKARALLEAEDEEVQGEELQEPRPPTTTRELPAFIPPMKGVKNGEAATVVGVFPRFKAPSSSRASFARPALAAFSEPAHGSMPSSSSHFDSSQVTAPAPSVDVFATAVSAAHPAPGLFSTANGRPIEAPTEHALEMARAAIAISPSRPRPTSRAQMTAPQEEYGHPSYATPSRPPFSVTDMLNGTPTKDGSRSPLLALENGTAPTSSTATAEVTLYPIVSSSWPAATTATPQRPRAVAPAGPAQPSSAFRPPLAGGPSTSASTPVSKKPTPAMRRLNLGMTPRARGGANGSPVPKFTTPFKNGKRPEGLTPAGVARAGSGETPVKAQARLATPTAKKAVGSLELVPKREAKTVMDLSEPAVPRMSLRDFGVYPGTVDEDTLRYLEIPEEVIEMDSTDGANFVFPDGRGSSHALTSLLDAGCIYATQQWVSNHYSLIIWKLASYVRAQPSMYEQHRWWSYDAAVAQLKYRYEREVNRAQRSCIKRIQERDSSSALPMVLCVSKVRYGDPESYGDEVGDGHEGTKEVIGLELTDGWYRIRSNVDATLKGAIERGKLKVGSKVAISGAKLDGPREGTEVLKALTCSSLVITGNSTSLSRWDARLGFVGHAFVATLASLSPLGGVVPLLDLIIERVFPCGYIDSRKGAGSDPWDEAEERRRQEEWSTGSKRARASLANKLDKADAKWEEIAELLREGGDGGDGDGEAAEPESQTSYGCEDPEEILDQLEGSTSSSARAAIVRRLSPKQSRSCLAKMNDKALQSKRQAAADVERELSLKHPPRNVRSFRVIRVRDARVSDPSKSQRTAQLTVWGTERFDNDFLREGKRYVVTNVMPKGMWTLRSAEITLSTRKDSKWDRVGASGAPVVKNEDDML